MSVAYELSHGVRLRSLTIADASALADAYRRNRQHLAPWEPERAESFFTEDAQRSAIRTVLRDADAGSEVPLVLSTDDRIVGRVNLTGIVRGAFRNANLGYWIDAELAGRGLMTAAVNRVADLARDELELHRIQAATLVHNEGSQTVLRRCGFSEFGLAADYLRIAGRWQDHRLFQRILDS